MHSESPGKFIYPFEDLILGILHIYQEEKSFEKDGLFDLVRESQRLILMMV